ASGEQPIAQLSVELEKVVVRRAWIRVVQQANVPAQSRRSLTCKASVDVELHVRRIVRAKVDVRAPSPDVPPARVAVVETRLQRRIFFGLRNATKHIVRCRSDAGRQICVRRRCDKAQHAQRSHDPRVTHMSPLCVSNDAPLMAHVFETRGTAVATRRESRPALWSKACALGTQNSTQSLASPSAPCVPDVSSMEQSRVLAKKSLNIRSLHPCPALIEQQTLRCLCSVLEHDMRCASKCAPKRCGMWAGGLGLGVRRRWL